MKQKISVVIPARNEEGYIKRTLFSLLNQTFQDFEVVIVDDNSWYVVRNTPRVTGFVGAGVIPVPLNKKEVDDLFNRMDKNNAPTKHQMDIEVGEIIRIVDGPFKELEGKVSDVDNEKGKIKILVSMFGRETPVELDFLQIKKL